MSNAKHTPGPWETKAQGEANHYFTMRDHPRRGGKDWMMSIQFNGELSVTEQEANIRLIDAVPELLEALVGLMGDKALESEMAWADACDKSRAAIAKAEGR